MHIDASAAAMLGGDLIGSLEHARSALSLSRESGHSRTELAASINIAQALEMSGDTDAAQHYLDNIVDCGDGNRHLLRAAMDGLANLWISKGDFERAQEVFLAAEHEFKEELALTLNWDIITELNSRARLQQALCHWSEAHSILSKALLIAHRSEDAVWTFRLSVADARCLALLGRPVEAVRALPARVTEKTLEPELLVRVLRSSSGHSPRHPSSGSGEIESRSLPSRRARTRERVSRPRSHLRNRQPRCTSRSQAAPSRLNSPFPPISRAPSR